MGMEATPLGMETALEEKVVGSAILRSPVGLAAPVLAATLGLVVAL
jgi:hypothetical protein